MKIRIYSGDNANLFVCNYVARDDKIMYVESPRDETINIWLNPLDLSSLLVAVSFAGSLYMANNGDFGMSQDDLNQLIFDPTIPQKFWASEMSTSFGIYSPKNLWYGFCGYGNRVTAKPLNLWDVQTFNDNKEPDPEPVETGNHDDKPTQGIIDDVESITFKCKRGDYTFRLR